MRLFGSDLGSEPLLVGVALVFVGIAIVLRESLAEGASSARLSALSGRLRFARLVPVVELGIIAVVGAVYVEPFLNFDDSVVPAGREFEGNSGWIGVARKAILDFGELPLWNHWIDTGLPYMADPLSHLFSPLATIPALVLGDSDGPRLAVVLTILASGMAQYYLGHVLGLRAPARVLASLIYMMNGQLMARFGFGHFDFGLAFPYLPLTFALVVRAMQAKEGLLYPLLAGASLAGLLFAGNVYYLFFSIPGLALATLIYAVGTQGGWPRVDISAVRRAAASGMWGVGLSAIQWVPWFESRDLVFKDSDRLLLSSLDVFGSVRTLFESDRAAYAAGQFGMLPGYLHEYYAYVGVLLLPALLLSPLAVRTGRARPFAASACLTGLYLMLASAAHTPARYLYELWPKLYDFRWPAREMALAMPFVLILAALGMDAALSVLTKAAKRLPLSWRPIWLLPWVVAPGIALGFTYLAVRDVWQANQSLYYFVPEVTVHSEIADWLSGDKDRPFLFDHFDGAWGVPLEYQEDGLKKLRASWAWRLRGTESVVAPDKAKVRLLPAPRYSVIRGEFDRPDAVLEAEIAGQRLYRLKDAPPYAGFIRRSEAAERPEAFGIPPPGGWLPWPFTDVRAAEASWPSTNQVLVVGAPGVGHDRLMVLESYVPGWRLKVDGRAAKVENLGGYLSTEALPGVHTYNFIFDPGYAKRGLAITGTTLVLALGLALKEPGRRKLSFAWSRLSGHSRL